MPSTLMSFSSINSFFLLYVIERSCFLRKALKPLGEWHKHRIALSAKSRPSSVRPFAGATVATASIIKHLLRRVTLYLRSPMLTAPARLGFVVLLASLVTDSLAAQTRQVRMVAAEGATQAVAAARSAAEKQGWQMSIAVVDPAGDLVAFHRMDGASPSSIQNALGKARTAARFRRPTQVYDSLIANGRTGLLNLENLTPLEGGIPLQLDGQTIGGIGVSGGTSAQDAVIAQAGAAAVKP